MSLKLSPYGFDFDRYAKLIMRPNVGFPKPTGPHDDSFPDSGLIHIPGAVSQDLCDQAVSESAEFDRLRAEAGCAIEDGNKRYYRVANLHLKSQALLKIGLDSRFHEAAGEFFGAKSTIYTSLYFNHGSQQDPHIDTPFFWTRPFNLFVGVWVALEDVQAEAGPLCYYPGSHKLFSSEQELRSAFENSGRDVQAMFKYMQSRIEGECAMETVLIKKGDAVIWHPGLMHGGTKASDPRLTRKSTVFHFAPLGTNVRDHRVFPEDFTNFPTYGIVSEADGYYCQGSKPGAMI